MVLPKKVRALALKEDKTSDIYHRPQFYYWVHFIDEETEGQRIYVICSSISPLGSARPRI